MNAKQSSDGGLWYRACYYGHLLLWTLGFTALIFLIGCTTVESTFQDGDTLVHRRVTVAPFASIEAEAMQWSYFLDQDGDAAQWQIEMGQESSGLDNAEQITALQVIAELVKRLGAAGAP